MSFDEAIHLRRVLGIKISGNAELDGVGLDDLASGDGNAAVTSMTSMG